jgi:hypothetical protein
MSGGSARGWLSSVAGGAALAAVAAVAVVPIIPMISGVARFLPGVVFDGRGP